MGARGLHRRGLAQVHGARQIHVERRAVPDAALYFDGAVVLLDDAVHGCESEAGALPAFFRREERFEDSRLRFRVHAAAGVGHRHLDVVARPQPGVRGDTDLVELDIAQLDRDLAAVGHGVARVDHQVHENLLDLRAIGEDRRRVRPDIRRDLNLRTDEPLQHALHAVGTSWSSAIACWVMTWRLLNASSWRVSPAARSAALMISSASARRSSPCARCLHEHLGVAVDRHQQVVEVVRDTAGETSNRLHLLGLPQLLLALPKRILRLLALEHVSHDGGKRGAFAQVQRSERKFARKLICRLSGGRSPR